ncbi:MAG: hypothetical protein ACJAYJ_003676 [Saprospiraceae bacterium]|jgi:hypothetical protein
MLQIERLHSSKTIKFYQGSEITFQTKDGQWYTRVLVDLNYENNWLLFVDGHTPLDQIVGMKLSENKKWSQNLGNQIMLFAPLWAAYTAIASAVDEEHSFQKGDYIIMGSALATGALLRLLFTSKTYKFSKKGKPSKKYRLRILDLNLN